MCVVLRSTHSCGSGTRLRTLYGWLRCWCCSGFISTPLSSSLRGWTMQQQPATSSARDGNSTCLAFSGFVRTCARVLVVLSAQEASTGMVQAAARTVSTHQLERFSDRLLLQLVIWASAMHGRSGATAQLGAGKLVAAILILLSAMVVPMVCNSHVAFQPCSL